MTLDEARAAMGRLAALAMDRLHDTNEIGEPIFMAQEIADLRACAEAERMLSLLEDVAEQAPIYKRATWESLIALTPHDGGSAVVVPAADSQRLADSDAADASVRAAAVAGGTKCAYVDRDIPFVFVPLTPADRAPHAEERGASTESLYCVGDPGAKGEQSDHEDHDPQLGRDTSCGGNRGGVLPAESPADTHRDQGATSRSAGAVVHPRRKEAAGNRGSLGVTRTPGAAGTSTQPRLNMAAATWAVVSFKRGYRQTNGQWTCFGCGATCQHSPDESCALCTEAHSCFESSQMLANAVVLAACEGEP